MAEAQGVQIANSNEAGPDSPTAHIVTFMQKPEYVPEKFYDAKTGAVDLKSVLKSYGELEKYKSSGDPKSETPAAGEPKPAIGEPNVTPVAAPIALEPVPGVSTESLKTFSDEITAGGKLSDASYDTLKTAGYSKPMVDAYVKGLTADRVVEQAVQEARIADTEIRAITDSVGGSDTLKEMQAWARASLTATDLMAYNKAVSSGDVSSVKLAVAGLQNAYHKANGSNASLIQGVNPGFEAADVYKSQHEVTAAINNPLYGKDAAYREMVSRKLGRSSL